MPAPPWRGQAITDASVSTGSSAFADDDAEDVAWFADTPQVYDSIFKQPGDVLLSQSFAIQHDAGFLIQRPEEVQGARDIP
jgi:hypothetical protein